MSYTSPFTGDVVQPTDVSYRSITLSSNLVLSWPIVGSPEGEYVARIMEVTPSGGGYSISMPPADQTSVGTDSLYRNLGSDTFTVLDADGGTIVSVAAGQAKYIYVTDNTTSAGVWGVVAFGVGTSNADSATLAGYGLLAIGAQLNQSHPTKDILTGGTFDATDRAQTAIWTGGAGTYTLPAASTLGDNWFTIFKNNGTGVMTISCASGTIDGISSKTFNPGDSAFIISNGSNYVAVGYGSNSNFAFTSFIKSVTSGSYTLSASEASNTIQTYIGTLTSSVTVTYPPVVNFYVISNQVVAGGYNLTITTGSGASVVVPAGNQVTVICDGTNFYNANTTQAGAVTTFSAANGSASGPSINFGSETNTGIYRSAVGHWNVSVLGNQIVDVNASGVSVTGTGTFSGGISGGTF